MIAWQKITEEHTWKKKDALRKEKFVVLIRDLDLTRGLFVSFWHLTATKVASIRERPNLVLYTHSMILQIFRDYRKSDMSRK